MKRTLAVLALTVAAVTAAPSPASAAGGPCAAPPKPAGQAGTWASGVDLGQPAPGTEGGLYTQRGWAGWGKSHLYDVGCLERAGRAVAGLNPAPAGKVAKQDPFSTIAGWEMGLAAFGGAVGTVVVRAASTPGDIWAAIDVGERGVRAVAGWHILASWLTWTMLAIGVWVMMRSRRDTLAQTWSQTFTAGVFLAAGVLVAGWQVSVGPSIDAAVTGTYQAAGQAATGQHDPAAGFGDFYAEKVMLPVWGAVHLGPDWQAVDEFAPRLYAAATYNRAEEAAALADPAERSRLEDAKQRDYRKVVDELAGKYPDAYSNLAGDTGRDRRAASGMVGVIFAALILMVVMPLAAFMAASRAIIRYGFAAWPGASVILAHPLAQAAGRVYAREFAKWGAIGVGSTVGLVATMRVIGDVMAAPVGWVPRAIAASGLCLLLVWLWQTKRDDLTKKLHLEKERATVRAVRDSRPARAARGAASSAASGARERARGAAASGAAGVKTHSVQAVRAAGRVARGASTAGRARVSEVVASRRARRVRAAAANVDPVTVPRKADPAMVSSLAARAKAGRPTRESLWVREQVEVARRTGLPVKAARKATGSVARVSTTRAVSRLGKTTTSASTGGVATAARMASAIASIKRRKAGVKA